MLNNIRTTADKLVELPTGVFLELNCVRYPVLGHYVIRVEKIPASLGMDSFGQEYILDHARTVTHVMVEYDDYLEDIEEDCAA